MRNFNENLHDTFPGTIVRALLTALYAVLITAASVSVASVSAQELEEQAEALPPLHTNQVELGILYNSQDSAKFGQYNGLNDSGIRALGNLTIRGSNGTLRWNLLGTDLGTTSRSISGLLSDPGSWELKASYDGLRHYITDTYQTPLLGNLGDNYFTLPESFGSVNANHSGTDAPFDPDTTRLLTPTQLGDFHTQDIHSDRDNASVGAEYLFSDKFSLRVNFNHLTQSGAKLIAMGNQGGINLLGGNASRGEAVNVLMNPTEFTTDTLTVAFAYQGDRGYLSLGYFGSLFKDRYNGLSWQASQRNSLTPACIGGQACYTNNTASTAPDNVFHQFNMEGGYVFSPLTRLTGGFSYGVNTQNDHYAPTMLPQADGSVFNMMQPGGLPQVYLDGEVDNVHGDAKLTHQVTRKLLVSASLNYNERDNKTKSNVYNYVIIGGRNYTGTNLPYSYRIVQAKFDADYRLSRRQKLNLGYEHEFTDRWCDGVPGGLECVSTPSNDEDKVEFNYRLRATDTVHVRVGYAYSDRGAKFADGFAANDGQYPVINADDRYGWRTHIFDARTQHSVKGTVEWQASDALDVGLRGRYSQNNYDAVLGVQNGKEASVNLDATYVYSKDATIAAYGSWQNSRRDLRSGYDGDTTTAPTQIWTNQLKQDSYAIGLSAKRSGLKNGKLELTGDVSYTFDTSHYATQLGYVPSRGSPCNDPAVLVCDTPDITTSYVTVKLRGTYKINDKGKVALGYLYQNLDSNDYYYNIYQYGYTPDRVIPTNEIAPNYDEHLISLSYLYEF